MIKTKIIGDINIPDELKTKESIAKYLNDNFGKVFNKENIAQLLAEVVAALGLANAENNNDNVITRKERRRLNKYLREHGFDKHDINKKAEVNGRMETPLTHACENEKQIL